MADQSDQLLVEDIARGLAHNINNVLASIIGNISVARASLPTDDPVRGRLDAAERASFRLQELTERLQLYSRRVQPVRELLAVERLIREALSRRGDEVTQEVEPGLWVHGDINLLSRAIRELVENAVEAGGAAEVSVVLDGDTVEIAVTDRGPGIDPSVAESLFGPFTTTRARGRGLGLPIVASMMRIHDGEIRHGPAAGGGTTFRLRLARRLQEPVTTSGPGVRVLVMDDEEALREVLGDMLQLLGHEVSVVEGGVEAMERFESAQRANRPYALVVLDLMIPGGSGGADILQRMRAIEPGLRAIVSSGYWAEATAHLGSESFQSTLIKPFTLSDVTAAVEKALDGGPGSREP